MKNFKCSVLIGIIFVILAGSLAHFLYNWSEHNYLVGLFTPVNESIWEHMKLLFFPMLLYSLIIIYQFRESHLCTVSSFCFGIIVGTLLIPFFYYTYTFILGKDIFLFDIGIFILSTLISFWLSYKLSLSCKCKPYTRIWIGLIGILIICFIIFTYHPPNQKIFEDPTISQNQKTNP